MKNLSMIFLILFAALYTGEATTFAQESSIPVKDLENKFYQSRKISDELIKKFNWESRTDVTREGKVMDILIEHFWYGKTGKPESKIINDEEAKLPSSFLMHKIAEKMKDKIMTFMDGLHAFLESYALTSQQEGSKFFVKAVIGNPDPDGEIIVAGNDVIVPGDKMLWWIDSKSYTLSRASISTTFEGEQVEFSASYKYISPGLNYIAFAEILVPGKSITVQLHAYDYNKMD